jgi:hypothetical protein
MGAAIPYGRGAYRGQDASVAMRESIDARIARLPRSGGVVVSNIAHGSSSVSCTANRLVLFPCNIQDRSCTSYVARVVVDVGAAASLMLCAMYVLRGSSALLARLPGTKAVISTASSGQAESTLSTTPDLYTDAQYFIGINVSDSGVSLLGSQSSSGSILASLYMDCSFSDGVPSLVYLSDLTRSTNIDVPYISYVSHDMEGVA